MLEVKPNNPRYPHQVTITRSEAASPFDEVTSRVLYQGCGRAYTDTTTTGDNNVDLNRRKCSIPMCFDKWTEPVLDGDIITVVKGVLTETGRVRDFEPDNDRTVIYWELVRV